MLDHSRQTPSTEIGSGSYRKHFWPPPSPSRSAAQPASQRSKSAQRRGHGRFARRRQRDAVPGLQGQESRSAGNAHQPRRGLAGRRDSAARERQAAEELGQWKTHREERKAIDATSPAAVTLALLLTDEEGIGNALVERSSSREERRTDDRQ
jgi:hypothetical protein